MICIYWTGQDKLWQCGHDLVSQARTLWAPERVRERAIVSQREPEWVREKIALRANPALAQEPPLSMKCYVQYCEDSCCCCCCCCCDSHGVGGGLLPHNLNHGNCLGIKALPVEGSILSTYQTDLARRAVYRTQFSIYQEQWKAQHFDTHNSFPPIKYKYFKQDVLLFWLTEVSLNF